MGRKKIIISSKKLEDLYIHKSLSTIKIVEIYKCSFSTIANRLSEYGISLKSPALARTRYPKNDFDGNKITKAYMIGFRIGDLNVYKPSERSETMVVRCHTTKKYQVKVLQSLFNKFGRVSVSFKKPSHFTVNCFLNRSFDFLLSKNENSWKWLKKYPRICRGFIAGYTDAEGNFIINQGRARFKIDSYD